MPLFGSGTDPKDELIALLKDERDHLRARVKDLEGDLFAALNPHAYRLTHPQEPAPPTKDQPSTPDPYTARGQVYKPEESLTQLAQQFRPGDES